MWLPFLFLGCDAGLDIPLGQTVVCSIFSGNQPRTYRFHAPLNYEGRPVPVVVALHGLGSDAATLETFTALSERADEETFAVIYPEGLEIELSPTCADGKPTTFRSWNAGACCAGSAAEGVDDVSFILAALEATSKSIHIDRDRVFAVGFSNGGFMASRLGVEHGNVFRAVASVEGGLSVDCDPNDPVSVLYVHGTEDPAVPYDGAPNRAVAWLQECGVLPPFEPIETTVARWVDAQGCDPREADVRTIGSSTTLTTWPACEDGIEVAFASVSGGGHTWPGSQNRWEWPRSVGPCVEDLDATDLVLDFLLSHA